MSRGRLPVGMGSLNKIPCQNSLARSLSLSTHSSALIPPTQDEVSTPPREETMGVCITKTEKAESEAQRGKPKGTLESESRDAIMQ